MMRRLRPPMCAHDQSLGEGPPPADADTGASNQPGDFGGRLMTMIITDGAGQTRIAARDYVCA